MTAAILAKYFEAFLYFANTLAAGEGLKLIGLVYFNLNYIPAGSIKICLPCVTVLTYTQMLAVHCTSSILTP
jgi:hypothetical protein